MAKKSAKPRKPIVPDFRFKVRFPSGYTREVMSRKDVQLLPGRFFDLVLEQLAELRGVVIEEQAHYRKQT